MFPKLWEEAYVTPIFKCNEMDVCSDYRPVCLGSRIKKKKMFEIILRKKFLNLCMRNLMLFYMTDSMNLGWSIHYNWLSRLQRSNPGGH